MARCHPRRIAALPVRRPAGRILLLAVLAAQPFAAHAQARLEPRSHDAGQAQRAGEPTPLTLITGDRVAFLGDSITQAATAPEGFIAIVSNACTQPGGPSVAWLNAGRSGNRINDLQARLDVDVLAWHPTVVVVAVGVNDVWLADHGLGTPPEAFEAGLHDLVKRTRAAGARTILCTPAVIGETPNGTNRFDRALDAFADLARRVAADEGTPLVDWRRAFTTRLREVNRDGAGRGILTGDGVHPNAAGNRLIAECLLRTLRAGDVPIESPPPAPRGGDPRAKQEPGP